MLHIWNCWFFLVYLRELLYIVTFSFSFWFILVLYYSSEHVLHFFVKVLFGKCETKIDCSFIFYLYFRTSIDFSYFSNYVPMMSFTDAFWTRSMSEEFSQVRLLCHTTDDCYRTGTLCICSLSCFFLLWN